MNRVGNIKQGNKEGFTIVELLIVVVVIAILATITIVGYRGIQNRAIDSSLQSTVSQALKKLEVLKLSESNGTYLSSKAEVETNITVPSGMELDYFYNIASNTYCIQVEQSGVAYSARSSEKTVTKSQCAEKSIIGWWKLNGNIDDATGNTPTGTVSGATVTTGQDGQSSGAYSFDGVDDSISLVYSPSLNPTAGGFSLSVWFNKAGSLSGERSILRKDSQYQIAMMGMTNIRNLFNTQGGTTGWTSGNDFPYTLSNGIWYNLVITWNGSILTSYINGAQVSTATVTGSPSSGGSHLVLSPSGLNVQGIIDDLRLFNKSLSVSEVSALYSEGAE